MRKILNKANMLATPFMRTGVISKQSYKKSLRIYIKVSDCLPKFYLSLLTLLTVGVVILFDVTAIPNSVAEVSDEHKRILDMAAKSRSSAGVSNWTLDRNTKALENFQDQFIRGHKDTIQTAARHYNVPTELVAAEIAHEASGKPPFLKNAVYYGRRLGIVGGKPEMTSIKPSAVQVGRAAQMWGYDTARLTPKQMDKIASSLMDPKVAIFATAAYLRHMANLLGYCENGYTGNWTPQQKFDIAATYRNGPGDEHGLTTQEQFRNFVRSERYNLPNGKYITPAQDGKAAEYMMERARESLSKPFVSGFDWTQYAYPTGAITGPPGRHSDICGNQVCPVPQNSR
jgi:hypothetical protein